jgi:hypothetical protein
LSANRVGGWFFLGAPIPKKIPDYRLSCEV